jgi:DNA polymerase-3 subunit gamma/tau
MSLYRTWRPRSFNDLVGQDTVVQTLQSALNTNRLNHAYLFSGPRGSGKTSAAKIMTRCINCEQGITSNPDNTCTFCEQIINGTAIDVSEIDAASNRGIDEIRALRESVKFAPATMRKKIYVIDEAHMLTKEGANAFLKTLEEPPPHAVFILATTNPEALPITILSRCLRFAFQRIPVADMIERMQLICEAEAIRIDDDALATIAYRADGGLRDALTMLEQASAFSNSAITVETLNAAFGATGHAFAHKIMAALLAENAVDALQTLERANDAGIDMIGLLRNIIAEYRNLIVAKLSPKMLARDLSPADVERSIGLLASATPSKVNRALRFFNEAIGYSKSSGNPRIEMEMVILKLLTTKEDPSVEALVTRMAELENQLLKLA